MHDSRPSRSKPRWYQYGLRSLLVLMVAASVGLGWLGSRMRRIVSERSGVSEIWGMGGRAGFGVIEASDFRTKLEDEMKYSPDRALRSMVGVDHTFVNWVELDNTRVTDSDLAIVAGLSGLEYLTLKNTQVSDVGLSHLRHLAHLQVLDLRGTRVTEAGVKSLQDALPSCKILH